MRFRLQLKRRTRQKQKALRSRRDGIHKKIFLTREIIFTDQMVRFVNNRQIPFRAQKILSHCGLAHHKFDRTDDIVHLVKRIRIIAFLLTAFEEAAEEAFIHQREHVVEAAIHFCHPLVLQGFRNKDQRARDAARAMQGMPDHTGFNRLAQTNFIRKHQTRYRTGTASPLAKIILVRNQIHARTDHASNRRPLPFARKFIRRFTTYELLIIGTIATDQLRKNIGNTRRRLRRQIRFLHLSSATAQVNRKTVIHADIFNDKARSLFVLGIFANRQKVTFNRSSRRPINARLFYSRKLDRYIFELNFLNSTYTKFRFLFTNITLTDLKCTHDAQVSFFVDLRLTYELVLYR